MKALLGSMSLSGKIGSNYLPNGKETLPVTCAQDDSSASERL